MRNAGVMILPLPPVTRGTLGARHCAVHPPSIGIAVPVMLCAIGGVSQSARLPDHDESEVRLDGCFSQEG